MYLVCAIIEFGTSCGLKYIFSKLNKYEYIKNWSCESFIDQDEKMTKNLKRDFV